MHVYYLFYFLSKIVWQINFQIRSIAYIFSQAAILAYKVIKIKSATTILRFFMISSGHGAKLTPIATSQSES